MFKYTFERRMVRNYRNLVEYCPSIKDALTRSRQMLIQELPSFLITAGNQLTSTGPSVLHGRGQFNRLRFIARLDAISEIVQYRCVGLGLDQRLLEILLGLLGIADGRDATATDWCIQQTSEESASQADDVPGQGTEGNSTGSMRSIGWLVQVIENNWNGIQSAVTPSQSSRQITYIDCVPFLWWAPPQRDRVGPKLNWQFHRHFPEPLWRHPGSSGEQPSLHQPVQLSFKNKNKDRHFFWLTPSQLPSLTSRLDELWSKSAARSVSTLWLLHFVTSLFCSYLRRLQPQLPRSVWWRRFSGTSSPEMKSMIRLRWPIRQWQAGVVCINLRMHHVNRLLHKCHSGLSHSLARCAESFSGHDNWSRRSHQPRNN